MSSSEKEREQLDLFRALPGDMAPRDAQDLMAYPFFSLAKSRRTAPIDFRSGGVTVRVEGTQEHGIATIWDADILIWAASQIVEARDAGIRPSRRMQATPYEILRFIGRGTSLRDYQRLKAALDRLQSTTIATSIRETTGRRLHRFSWINEWKERTDAMLERLGDRVEESAPGDILRQMEEEDREHLLLEIRRSVSGLPDRQKTIIQAFVDHFPETEDREALRRLVSEMTGRDETRAAVSRAFYEARRKVAAILKAREI